MKVDPSNIQQLLPYLTVWGAILSTILGGLKIQEGFRDRFRLVVKYSFDSRPEEGNDIIIYNPSKTPVMIDYYELRFFEKRYGFYSKFKRMDYPDEGYCNISINAHAHFIMNFSDADHFDWGKQKIDILLHIVGRKKPMRRLVYRP